MNRIWAILLLLALAGVALVLLAGRSPFTLVPVFAATLFKSRLIVLDFMGFRNASFALRHGLVAWALALSLAAVGKLLITGMIAS
ncbi:cytochrome C oxidase subunit IV family protein [Mesorhizobium sp.]|uniref:cytochrome C oxidase subunit IV family protein n=2 Tax=Mesorhizobium sp. TaxID=1871066 RepID=UPI001211B012|nr:cytochrome C oxidase subunit IV family protein [Mesorhizobium sp.]TIP07820.1 MAG: hypothetical protein E5X73_35030 [Mesorhizobium sp.]